MNNNLPMPTQAANPLSAVVKDVEVVPVAVPKGMAEVLAATNTKTKALITTLLDRRFATTSPWKASKIARISVIQSFSVVPDSARLDIEIAQ